MDEQRDLAVEIAAMEKRIDKRLLFSPELPVTPTQNVAAMFGGLCDLQRQYIEELKAKAERAQEAALESGRQRQDALDKVRWSKADYKTLYAALQQIRDSGTVGGDGDGEPGFAVVDKLSTFARDILARVTSPNEVDSDTKG